MSVAIYRVLQSINCLSATRDHLVAVFPDERRIQVFQDLPLDIRGLTANRHRLQLVSPVACEFDPLDQLLRPHLARLSA